MRKARYEKFAMKIFRYYGKEKRKQIDNQFVYYEFKGLYSPDFPIFQREIRLINRSFIQIKQENFNANQVKPYCDFPCRNKSQQQGLYS